MIDEHIGTIALVIGFFLLIYGSIKYGTDILRGNVGLERAAAGAVACQGLTGATLAACQKAQPKPKPKPASGPCATLTGSNKAVCEKRIKGAGGAPSPRKARSTGGGVGGEGVKRPPSGKAPAIPGYVGPLSYVPTAPLPAVAKSWPTWCRSGGGLWMGMLGRGCCSNYKGPIPAGRAALINQMPRCKHPITTPYQAKHECFRRGGLFEPARGPFPACCDDRSGTGVPNCRQICPPACANVESTSILNIFGKPRGLGQEHMSCKGCFTGGGHQRAERYTTGGQYRSGFI